MAIDKYQFLTEESVATFVNQLFTKTALRLDQRIVQEINADSSDKQYLSAIALHNLLETLRTADTNISARIDANGETLTNNANTIKDIQKSQDEQDAKLTTIETGITDTTNRVGTFTHLTIQTITGTIDTVTDPSDTVLYFQRDNEQDTTWSMYVYQAPANEGEDGTWIMVGDTEVDLSGIWSKDDTEALKEALGVHNAERLPDDDIAQAVEDAFNVNQVDYRADVEGEPTVAAQIAYGTNLSDVAIGGTMMYDGVEVPGVFTWETTNEEFQAAVEAAPEV